MKWLLGLCGVLLLFIVVSFVINSHNANRVGGSASSSSGSGNPAHDMLKALSNRQQAQALGQSVETSGDSCTGVKAVHKGMADGRALWRVDCSNGNSYLVTIEDDAQGTTKVLSCAVAKAIGADC